MSLMWSWHWSPLTQTSLLLSPSDGLASFLKTTLANGVKVVKKVITSKFRVSFDSNICIGVFSHFQLHTCTYQNYLEEPPPPPSSEKCLYIDIWCLFFIKKNVTKCLGHHYAIWTSDLIFYWPKKNNFGPALGTGPHWHISTYIVKYTI